MKLQYAVACEQTPSEYCDFIRPHLPGYISTGKTWEDIQEMIREAIALHIEAMMGRWRAVARTANVRRRGYVIP